VAKDFEPASPCVRGWGLRRWQISPWQMLNAIKWHLIQILKLCSREPSVSEPLECLSSDPTFQGLNLTGVRTAFLTRVSGDPHAHFWPKEKGIYP
jgi:hypothetical protein